LIVAVIGLLYKKLVPETCTGYNTTQLYLVPVSFSRNFQMQPTNQPIIYLSYEIHTTWQLYS